MNRWTRPDPDSASDIDDQAADAYVQRSYGEWSEQDQRRLEQRLADDADYAAAFRRIEEASRALDRHAQAPELEPQRAQAIEQLHAPGRDRPRANTRPRPRWLAAGMAASLLLALMAWQLSPYGDRGDEYRTGIGERRVVELEDRSRIVLDAATVLQVDYSRQARVIRLEQGQAQFFVAKDPQRPFNVLAGTQRIVALGTVFTVEHVGSQVRVAMMEGRVAVRSSPDQAARLLQATVREVQADEAEASIELVAGQGLKVERVGSRPVVARADLEASTAWLEGRVVLRSETLADAVQRLNRYSTTRIEIADGALAEHRISGVFEAGDAEAFVSAIERYLPVAVERGDDSTIQLHLR